MSPNQIEFIFCLSLRQYFTRWPRPQLAQSLWQPATPPFLENHPRWPGGSVYWQGADPSLIRMTINPTTGEFGSMLIYSFICQQILKCLCFRKWMIQRVKSNKGNYSPIKSFCLSCTLENTEGYNCWFNCSSGYGSTNQPLRLSTLMRRILCSPDVSSEVADIAGQKNWKVT